MRQIVTGRGLTFFSVRHIVHPYFAATVPLQTADMKPGFYARILKED